MDNKLNILSIYDRLLDDIKSYNKADTVNMSENEMNKFRHIAAPAVLTSQYYSPSLVRTLGYGKEVKDLFQGRGLDDTKYDLKNNELGISIGLKYPNNNQNTLFDYIFENEIKPYR